MMTGGLEVAGPYFGYNRFNPFLEAERWIGLSTFGSPLAKCNRSSYVDLGISFRSSVSHISVERLKFCIERDPTAYDDLISLFASHTKVTRESQQAFQDACDQYRAGFFYSRIFIQSHKDSLERTWRQIDELFQNAISYLQSLTTRVSKAQKVFQIVETCDKLFWKHTENDLDELSSSIQALSSFAANQEKSFTILTHNDLSSLRSWLSGAYNRLSSLQRKVAIDKAKEALSKPPQAGFGPIYSSK